MPPWLPRSTRPRSRFDKEHDRYRFVRISSPSQSPASSLSCSLIETVQQSLFIRDDVSEEFVDQAMQDESQERCDAQMQSNFKQQPNCQRETTPRRNAGKNQSPTSPMLREQNSAPFTVAKTRNDPARELRLLRRNDHAYTTPTRSNALHRQSSVPSRILPAANNEITFVLECHKLYPFHGQQIWLSNFHPIAIMVDGITYATVEHFYQLSKVRALLPHKPVRYQILQRINRISHPGVLKQTVKTELQKLLDPKTVQSWKRTKGPTIVYRGLQAKYSQHAQMRQRLLNTSDQILIHAYVYDKQCGCGMEANEIMKWAQRHQGMVFRLPTHVDDRIVSRCPTIGVGKNMLGWLSMIVRHELMHST